MATPELNLKQVMGFGGQQPRTMECLILGSEKYLVYPLGSTVVIKHVRTDRQAFLVGHKGSVRCLTVSPCGKYIASGDRVQAGKASIILWDAIVAIENGNSSNRDGELLARKEMHNLEVAAVDFSSDSKYLATIGGQDDNNVVVWNINGGGSSVIGQALSGQTLGGCTTKAIKWYTNPVPAARGGEEYRFVTAGLDGVSRIWRFYHDDKMKKMQIDAEPAKVEAGNTKRNYQVIALSGDDRILGLGSASGDIILFDVSERQNRPYATKRRVIASKRSRAGEERHSEFAGAIVSLKCIPTPPVYQGLTQYDFVFVVGGGGGKIAIIGADEGEFTPDCSLKTNMFSDKLMGGINSISIESQVGDPDSSIVWVGTNEGNIYTIDLDAARFRRDKRFNPELKGTSHYTKINSMCFAQDCAELLITASDESIRVWNCQMGQELLRISIPNVICNTVVCHPNGSIILSGWNDGKIRGFLPESGKLKFVIQDAHQESCTALAVIPDAFDDSWRLVSGGKDGRVRIWKISEAKSEMLHSFKEHRNAVRAIQVTKDGTKAVSAAEDGSCIIWDLLEFSRKDALFGKTKFKGVVYHPDESQLLTCGTDRFIAYWEAEDVKTCIRQLVGSPEGDTGGALSCIDVAATGDEADAFGLFVTGGEDKLVKLWNYDEGECMGTGKGHSGYITDIKISPDHKTIVSVGTEGAIMVWDMPAF